MALDKTLAIIQARMGSTRLPGKVLMKVAGTTLLEYEINRLRRARKINKIVVATTSKKEDDKIEDLCRKIKIDCFRGSEEDVLDRYYQCALKYPSYKHVVRITGDCPLIDPALVDATINLYQKTKCDYASNVNPPTYPDGMDAEIFKKSILEDAARKAFLPSDREHVNEYILRNKKIKKSNLAGKEDWSHFRLTVDNSEDFEVIKFLIKNSASNDGFLKYVSLLTKHPEMMFKNMHIKRNEGFLESLQKDKLFLKKLKNEKPI